jgi:hypothetical protein
MNKFPITLLLLAGAGFAAFGMWLVIDPVGGLAAVGISAANPAGVIELRALYGGLELGLGLFLLKCAARPGWRRPGLWAVMLGNGGIGVVRLAAIALTGVFAPFFAYALAWELGFASLAGWALYRSRAGHCRSGFSRDLSQRDAIDRG